MCVYCARGPGPIPGLTGHDDEPHLYGTRSFGSVELVPGFGHAFIQQNMPSRLSRISTFDLASYRSVGSRTAQLPYPIFQGTSGLAG